MEHNLKIKKVGAKKPSAKIAKQTTKETKPTVEQIQARAYQIYIENGYRGNEMDNWLKAEKELK